MSNAPLEDGVSPGFVEWLHDNGYTDVKALPNGTLCAIQRQLFTTGICIGVDRVGYKRRYCYECELDARKALREWNGDGDPSGPWIKEKPSERLGPGATKE